MYVGSLFSGIGGIELGFEAAGFRTKWFVEKDEYARSVIRKHWKDALIYEDVTKIDFRTVPKINILTGGFPCQDISLAGKGEGISGSRSSLWKYYKKAIRVLRPRYAFIENVPAIIGRGLNVVLADLAEVGYDAEWYNLSASAVGAFHKRERLFIVAYLPKQGIRRLSIQQWNQGEKNVDVNRYSETFSDSLRSGGGFNGFRNDKNRSKESEKRGRKQRVESCENGSDIAKSDRPGQQRKKSLCGNRGYWSVEPKLGRVVNGIPHRVDRIRCLGNAVVPQMAYVFAQAIKEIEVYEKNTT